MERLHHEPPPKQFDDVKDRPDWGVVVEAQIEQPEPFNDRIISKNANVTYTIRIYTANETLLLERRVPNQNRWDCWFYPAPVNSIVDVFWFGTTIYFRVDELPVTEDC